MKRLNKSAQGHVEMIISFVIFISAMIIIFIFISPFAKTRNNDNSVDELQNKIINKISSDIGKISVIVDSASDCYDSPIYGNDFIEIKEADRKYTLYYNLSGNGARSCSSQTGRKYSLGVYTKENFIVEKKIKRLVNDSDSDYNSVKNNFAIAKDFSFGFRELNGNKIDKLSFSRNIPAGVNVNSKEIPVRVINESASIKELILNIKVW